MSDQSGGEAPYGGEEQGAWKGGGGGPEDPGEAPPGPLSESERTAAVWAHLLGGIGLLFGFSFLGPLIIWIVKKDDGAFVEDQAREALNFHLVVFVGLVVASFSILCVVGFVLLPVLWIAALVLSVVGAMKANEGVRYRYPYIFRILS